MLLDSSTYTCWNHRFLNKIRLCAANKCMLYTKINLFDKFLNLGSCKKLMTVFKLKLWIDLLCFCQTLHAFRVCFLFYSDLSPWMTEMTFPLPRIYYREFFLRTVKPQRRNVIWHAKCACRQGLTKKPVFQILFHINMTTICHSLPNSRQCFP